MRDEGRLLNYMRFVLECGGVECGTNVRGHFYTDVRVLYAREIFTRSFSVAKLLEGLVARDGIEPPTPAFSGPRSTN